MSKNNTMTSAVSDLLSQQQLNLQHLHNLQQHTRSMTSADHANVLQQQQQQQQAQSASFRNGSLTSADINQQNYLNGQPVNSTSNSTFQNNRTLTMNSGGLQGTVTNGAPNVDSSTNVTIAATEGNNNSSKPLQGRNSLTNTSLLSRARSSLQRQRLNQQQQQQQDPRSPLVILVPTAAQPTDILAARFSAWRNVIKSVIVYLTEIASIQDEIVRQQLRLSHAVQFPFFSIENQYQPSSQEDKSVQKFFLPLGNGSVQDLPTILNQYHESLASSASKASRELTNDVIPRLEDLRRDLLVKIKEIKSLQSDFKNSCSKELQQTKQAMKQFQESLKEARYSVPKQDPFLTKLALDKQIKRQLQEENFLHEAFDNLETSGAELEKIVVMEIQNSLTIYARLLGQEAQLVFDILISKLDSGFFNIDSQFEWDNFISRDPNFLLPNLPMRTFKEIVYKYQFDPLTYEIKSGFLERRSKFLKSYSKGYYVLTPNFLHEFKTADRKKDLVPVMSLALSECTVTEHSRKNTTSSPNSAGSDAKFVLHAKQNGIIRRGHNWVFKADSYETMMSWFDNLKILTSTASLQDKYKFITQKLNLNSDGKPKANDNNPGNVKYQQNNTNNTTMENDENDDMNSNYVESTITPKLDNQTNTNTSMSSLPNTNDSELQDQVPNIYIQTPISDFKS
ncbi:Phosphoinositide PI4,5P(2) binding protein [Saccharomyces pastorianus]|uniref:Phosphoinositide PI4,5P(2) binding protein n=1 Tax=Saccharomyces pastorianus TaxID=27292 RepID=A0A6C1E8X5_SACPS|nr:Phosphoinositide PI4,5P(2) binding protein [Saccharomyces pastorianus]